MIENHFRSHFLSFQINTQLLLFSQNGCRRPFWMTENHFRSHFRSIRNFYFFSQNGCRRPFWMTEKSLSIAFLVISDQYATFIFFIKWLPATILDDRKSLSIAFLAISDQYSTFFFFTKWLPTAILDDRKSLSIAFLAIPDQYATFCVSVCVCVRSIFWYFSAIRRDIDLKFIQDTYMVVLNSLKAIDLHRSKVKVIGTLFFEGTVISQKLSQRKTKCIHLLGSSIR